MKLKTVIQILFYWWHGEWCHATHFCPQWK